MPHFIRRRTPRLTRRALRSFLSRQAYRLFKRPQTVLAPDFRFSQPKTRRPPQTDVEQILAVGFDLGRPFLSANERFGFRPIKAGSHYDLSEAIVGSRINPFGPDTAQEAGKILANKPSSRA